MPLLASVCRVTAGRTDPLLRIDPDSGRVAGHALPGLPPDATLMGLCVHEDGYLALYERHRLAFGGAGGLVRLGPDLSVRQVAPLARVNLPHSILSDAEGILCVSSRHDSVVRLHLLPDGSVGEEMVWQAPPFQTCGGGGGRHHVNSLCRWRGRLHVSLFGGNGADQADEEGRGAVWEIPSGRVLCRGLRQPHSLFVDDRDRLLVLDSLTGRVLDIGGDEPRAAWTIPGYVRGIAIASGRLHVATSRSRPVSRTTGRLRNVPVPWSDCALHSIDRPTGAVSRLDLSVLAAEIYDLLETPLPLPD